MEKMADIPQGTTLGEFWDILDEFNWLYHLEEDNARWRAGCNAHDRIMRFLGVHREAGIAAFERLYNEFFAHMNGNAAKPRRPS